MLLDGNLLTEVEPGAFLGLENVTQLYLSNNRIRTVAPFTALRKLEILDLGGNHMTELPNNTFAGLYHLTKLQLQFNKITSLRTQTFADLRVSHSIL